MECDERGEPIAVVGVTQNVTDQVREEEERREAQKIYKIMAEEASAIISLHPPGGGAFFVSNSFERVHGLKVYRRRRCTPCSAAFIPTTFPRPPS